MPGLKSNFILVAAMALALFYPTAIQAGECKSISTSDFAKMSRDWHGKTLIATASWCSSCKSKLVGASEHPESYVVLVAFDEPGAVEAVLSKFGIQSPCIAGDDIVKVLKIESLPWYKEI